LAPRIDSVRFAPLLALAEAGLFLWLFGPALHAVAVHALADQNVDYMVVAPLVAAYLFYEKWPRPCRPPARPCWTGVWLLSAGLIFLQHGTAGQGRFVVGAAAWLSGVALLWHHVGRDNVRALSLPIFFLLAAVPLPDAAYRVLVDALRAVSTAIGIAVARASGMALYHQGWWIDTGINQFRVIDACSGIRYFIPMGLLCVLIADRAIDTRARQVSVVVFGLAAVVLANGLRIALTFHAAGRFGMDVALGFFHESSGWLIFMVSLALVLGWVALIRPRSRIMPLLPARKSSEPSYLTSEEKRTKRQCPVESFAQQIACLVLLCLAFILYNGFYSNPGP